MNLGFFFKCEANKNFLPFKIGQKIGKFTFSNYVDDLH